MSKRGITRITREQEDLEMLKNPEAWPLWPLLPIKRSCKNNSPECALMFASGKPEVILLDLYGLEKRPGFTYAEKLVGIERVSYGTFEDMAAAGWRPD